MFALLVTGCENIYDPDLEKMENVIVADARIVYGQKDNYIQLTRSLNFVEESNGYPVITGGKVTIIDNAGKEYKLPETSIGYFKVNFEINPELSYKIRIEHAGNTFESDFESVPKVPELDSIYAIHETKVLLTSGENDISDRREVDGLRLYADIVSETEMPYYRFAATKVMQYTYEILVPFFGDFLPMVIYCWNSYNPQESFNLAAPPEYSGSTEINKPPLFFLEDHGYISTDQSFAGWILILYQYGLSKSSHDY
ncbi:MAG: DUF4249 family protein, partial [Draconibacterium sp.]|nr:DUF4249 family protein [Draconibacterium sp.]